MAMHSGKQDFERPSGGEFLVTDFLYNREAWTMTFDRIKYHLPRIKRQLGSRLVLGQRRYKVDGYNANRFTDDTENEAHLIPVFQRILQSPGTFIDIGANTGQTLVKVLSIDSDRHYLGFEPQVECCFQVDRFLRINNITTATIVPIALSSQNGMAQLFFNVAADVTASLVGGQMHSSWICARRGDEILTEMNVEEIAGIKIDVEGFEYEVLLGLASTLASKRPPIVFEVLTNWYGGELLPDDRERAKRQERADKIFSLLTHIGYSIAQIDSEGNEHAVSCFALDQMPRFSNDGRDYIAR